MGMEKYELFVKRAGSVLCYDPGWSRENRTGSWRVLKPRFHAELCNECSLCWLYCPDGCIDAKTFEIDTFYCKGCGICAQECKRGAIEMVRETE